MSKLKALDHSKTHNIILTLIIFPNCVSKPSQRFAIVRQSLNPSYVIHILGIFHKVNPNPQNLKIKILLSNQ